MGKTLKDTKLVDAASTYLQGGSYKGKILETLENRYEQLLNEGQTTFSSDEVNNLIWSIWNLRMELEGENEYKRAN